MKITNFDKQLFKSKDNTKARDFAGEANVKLNARKLIGDEDAALKVFDSTISEVYSDAAVHDAQTLTFPPANTDVFCVNRGKFLKPKRIETDYFAKLGEAYAKGNNLLNMPWNFNKLFYEYEQEINKLYKPGNRFVLFIKPFGLTLVAALVTLIGYQLTQWTKCPIPFLQLFALIPAFGGAIATIGLFLYAMGNLIFGDDNNNYPALTKSYLRIMRYLRIRALWYQSVSGTDKVPDYIADAESKVQLLAEKWMKKIKKHSGVKYNKLPDEKACGADLNTPLVSVLNESEKKKKYLPIEYKGFNIKGSEYEAKFNYDKAYEFYAKSAECGDINYFYDALRVALAERLDGSNDFEQVHKCCLLYDELGHPNNDATMLKVYSAMAEYCEELKDNAFKVVLKAMGKDPNKELSPIDYMDISKKYDVLEAIKMGGFYHTKLALYGNEFAQDKSKRWLTTQLTYIAESGKDIEEVCFWIEKRNLFEYNSDSDLEKYLRENVKAIINYLEFNLLKVIDKLFDKGKKNEAQKALLAMAKVRMPKAMTYLADLYAEEKNYKEALIWAEKAKKAGFENENIDKFIDSMKKFTGKK